MRTSPSSPISWSPTLIFCDRIVVPSCSSSPIYISTGVSAAKHPSLFIIISPQEGQGFVSFLIRFAVSSISGLQVCSVSLFLPFTSKQSGQTQLSHRPHFQTLDRKPLQSVAVHLLTNFLASTFGSAAAPPAARISSRPARMS